MSAWEDVPTGKDLEDWETDELEEYLQDVYRDLRDYVQDAKLHDEDGYLCDLAGSEACLALGHVPNEHGEWSDEDDQHPSGWDGDLLCKATRYATACSYCEGECSFESLPRLWTLPGVFAA